MKYEDSHLADEQLLLEIDGELSESSAKKVRAHLDSCWRCRVRSQELESAISDFVRAYQGDLDFKLPPHAGPRALLKAQLAKHSETESSLQARWFKVFRNPVWRIAATALLVLGLFFLQATHRSLSRTQDLVVSLPDPKLTPGAAYLSSKRAVCAGTNMKNKAVSVALQRRVFEEYGIGNAEPRAYEVDYLVTPALGGSDDIRNLWPHSYSATAWNARVKDALEDRLRTMVCDGSLDLTEAQREISTNWITAYKKYFHTGTPLVSQ
jgi:anti-sigma factor RsiW